MPKILHAADLHLDSAFTGLPPEKARERRRESRELPERLADLVLDRGVELVLLAGDVFDGERVYPETLESLRAALERMACPVVIAPGNHDPYTAHGPYAACRWPANVHIFREPYIQALELPALGCTVYGAAFTAPERLDMALADFSPVDRGGVRLLCLHGDLDRPESRYGPLTREQLGRCGLDYAALGHIHQCSGLRRWGAAAYAYPGCPEGRGFDELGEKGVLLGTVERGRAELDFVPVCRRRYWVLEADVTGATAREALERAVPAGAEGDICRVVFTGETAGTVDLAALETAFAHRFYALQLRDETCVARELWAQAGESTLRGLFLQRMRERYDGASDDAERERIVRAVRFGLAAMEGRDLG